MSFIRGSVLAILAAFLVSTENASSFAPQVVQHKHSKALAFNSNHFSTDAKVGSNHGTTLYAFQQPNESEQQISTKLDAFAMEDVGLTMPEEERSSAAQSYFEQFTSFFGNEYGRGLLICVIITIIFSSNSPALHLAFSSVETPPPALLVNAGFSCIALAGIALGGPLIEAVQPPTPSSLERNQEKTEEESPNAPILGGLELGMWKGLGMTANVFGLSMTTANHAAFLIQLTTLLVPVAQGFMGYPISARIWTSVALALSGVFLFTQEAVVTGTASNMALGDALCLLAAFFYAGYDIRCFEWGKKVPARELITNKIAVQALLSVILLVGVGWDQATEFFTTFSSTLEATLANDPGSLVLLGGVILWSGLTVNSLAPFVQVFAQQAVGPTKAQTIYASQPMWAALLSFFILGETVGIQGAIGATAFVAALVLAATAEADPATLVDEADEA